MNIEKTINHLSRSIHDQNKTVGWWDKPRTLKTLLMLCVTEVAEATEGERKDLMDDHLPHRKMGEVELADTLTRVLDIAGCHGWSYKHVVNTSFMLDVAELHFNIVKAIVDLHHAVTYQKNLVDHFYSAVVRQIFECARQRGYDVLAALQEKVEYNLTRPDHTREARAEANGKRF